LTSQVKDYDEVWKRRFRHPQSVGNDVGR